MPLLPALPGRAAAPRASSPIPFASRLTTGLAVLLVTASALLGATAVSVGLAPPAAAHDRLVSADPEDGATLDEPPGVITLTFSAELLAAGAQVGVGTPDGDVAAEVVVDGEVVTATLPDGLPAGDYDVRWRVVSSDGHPIEGELGYVVASAAEPSVAASDPDESVAPSEEAGTEPSASVDTGSTAPATPSADGHQHAAGTPGVELDAGGEAGWAVAWLFGVVVLAAVGVAAAVVLRQRRMLAELDERTAAGGDDAESDGGRPDGTDDGRDDAGSSGR